MDNHRFDAIARSLATGASRRRVIRAAAAAGAGGLVALVGRRGAKAAPCGPGRKKCGGECIPIGHECVKGGGPPQGSPPGQNP